MSCAFSENLECPFACSIIIFQLSHYPSPHKVLDRGCATGAVKCHQTHDAPMQQLFVDSCMGEHYRAAECRFAKTNMQHSCAEFLHSYMVIGVDITVVI